MIIGLVGKPSSGKSTFFKAATLAEVDIANYPFTTIEKNEGVGFVRVDCADKDFNIQCNPRFGYCVNGKRFVPVQLIDVAGLVPGAHKGKGRGNQFLDDLRQADVLVHVIDISGSTDSEGNPVDVLSYDPLNDVQFLEDELDYWYFGILKKGWDKFARQIKQEDLKVSTSIAKQLSGLKVDEEMVEENIKSLNEDPMKWNEDELFSLAKELRKKSKKIIIAANKIDVKGSEKNFERLKEKFPDYIVVKCSSEIELSLKEAAKKDLIKYVPGDNKFEVVGELKDKQKQGLDFIKKFLNEFENTGVQDVLDKAIFELLKYMAIFPGGVNKLEDSEGRKLPDCFLLKEGSTALDFAFKLHTDFGKNFIRAIDVKTKRTVGKEHKLKHRDVVEIISGK